MNMHRTKKYPVPLAEPTEAREQVLKEIRNNPPYNMINPVPGEAVQECIHDIAPYNGSKKCLLVYDGNIKTHCHAVKFAGDVFHSFAIKIRNCPEMELEILDVSQVQYSRIDEYVMIFSLTTTDGDCLLEGFERRDGTNIAYKQPEKPIDNDIFTAKAEKLDTLDLSGNCAFLVDSGGFSVYTVPTLVKEARLSIWIMLFMAYKKHHRVTCQMPEPPSMPAVIENYFKSSVIIA